MLVSQRGEIVRKGISVEHGGDPYRELFEHSPDAILVIEEDRFVDCNPAAVRMLRFPNKQALMVEAALVAPDEIRTEVEALVDSFQPIFDLFEAADFEASRINEADFDALADAAFSGENSTRGKTMDDWVNINCDE